MRLASLSILIAHLPYLHSTPGKHTKDRHVLLMLRYYPLIEPPILASTAQSIDLYFFLVSLRYT